MLFLRTPILRSSARAAVLSSLVVRLLKVRPAKRVRVPSTRACVSQPNPSHSLCALLQDALTELVYNAELSGLEYAIGSDLTMIVKGYNHKLFTVGRAAAHWGWSRGASVSDSGPMPRFHDFHPAGLFSTAAGPHP